MYKVKDAAVNGEIVLQPRRVLHGNRDRARYTVSRDYSSEDLLVVRVVIYVFLTLVLDFGADDVKGEYMQRGPVLRDIYVRPPK